MKKVLFGTTALVAAGLASAGAAVAQDKKDAPIQMSVGGYFDAAYHYVSQDDGVGTALGDRRGHGMLREAEIWFRGTTTLANGLQVGVRVELEAEDCTDQIDESFIFFSHAYGRVELGQTDGVANKMWYGAPTPISSHGVNSPTILAANIPAGSILGTPTTYLDNSGDFEKLTYFTPRMSGFQLGVSYTPSGCEEGDAATGPTRCGGSYAGMQRSGASASGRLEDGFDIAANYVRTIGGVDVALYAAYARMAAALSTASFDDNTQWGAGASLGYAGFTLGGGYKKSSNRYGARDVDQRDWNVGLAYATGPWTLGVQYHDAKAEDPLGNAGSAGQEDEYTGVSLGAMYELGPGIKLYGGVQYFDWSSNITTAPKPENEAWDFVIGTRLDF
jgi:predicted porin